MSTASGELEPLNPSEYSGARIEAVVLFPGMGWLYLLADWPHFNSFCLYPFTALK